MSNKHASSVIKAELSLSWSGVDNFKTAVH